MPHAGWYPVRVLTCEPRCALRRPTGYLIAIWAALLAGSVLLALAAHAARPFPFDIQVSRELQEPRALDPIVTPLMVAVSALGHPPWNVLLYGVAVGVLLLVRRWAMAVLVALTLSGDALAAGVKLLVVRPRPSPDLIHIYQQVTGYSFPSGHVVHYVVFYGVIAYLAWGALQTRPGPRRGTRLLLTAMLVACVSLILLVGASRVYLGAHWPTDVLGGYLLGSAWLLILLAAYRRWLAARWVPRPG
jgi:membrane-associated phospholipid phosphatase